MRSRFSSFDLCLFGIRITLGKPSRGHFESALFQLPE